MEIDKFIERNLMQFLDKKNSEVADKAALLREEEFSMFEITSDYAKELNVALRNNDLEKAKQVFEEVKDKYVQAAEGSISKKRLYSIMEEIYERIKDYEGGPQDRKLLDTIREYERHALLKNPELFDKQEQSIGLLISSISFKEKEIEDVLAQPEPSYHEIEKAAKSYRELKELIKGLPPDHADLRGKASEKAMTLYSAIKDKLTAKPKNEKDPQEDTKSLDNRLAEIRQFKENLIDAHRQINKFMQEENLAGAVKEYRKLRKYCEQFPKELSEERLAILAETKSLYDKLITMKDALEAKKKTGKPAGPSEHSLQSLRDKLTISQRVIEEHLAQDDVKGAAKEYTHLKLLCRDFPKDPNPQEKVDVLSAALAIFGRIKKAEENLSRRKKEEEDLNSESEEERAKFESFRNELDLRISHVKEFLAQKDSQSAIRAYSELREYFNSFPDNELERKRLLYEDILSAHLDMDLLDKDFKAKSAIQSGGRISEIRKLLVDLQAMIDNDKPDDAAHAILEAKHKVVLLPRESFDEKYDLMKEIDDLEQKVVESRNLIAIDSRKYQGAQAQQGENR